MGMENWKEHFLSKAGRSSRKHSPHQRPFSLPEAQEVSPLCSGTATIAFYIPSLESPPLIIKTPQGTKKTSLSMFQRKREYIPKTQKDKHADATVH